MDASAQLAGIMAILNAGPVYAAPQGQPNLATTSSSVILGWINAGLTITIVGATQSHPANFTYQG